MYKLNTALKPDRPSASLAAYLNRIDGFYDFVDSELFLRIKTLPVKGIYRMERADNLRMDAISHSLYGTTDMWWLLLSYNDIVDPYDVPKEGSLKYFAIESLEKLYFNLKTKAQLEKRFSK